LGLVQQQRDSAVLVNLENQVEVADSLDVEVHGDVALVTGRMYVLPESNDPAFQGVTVRYVRVYRRQAGRWQQLTHHSTKQTFGPPSP
jgi:ketosteroid isomerase-like protein